MKTVLLTLATIGILGALAAGAVVGFGLYNVSARMGHLPGVSPVLHTTYRRSVRLRAPGPEAVPDDLGSPDRIELGAQHFRSACAFCHSMPGQAQSATARAMVPRPPHVEEAVRDWAPRHLFWIVHEGVKMSGMPHWPAPRADEVWSVVAWLAQVKRGAAPVPDAPAPGAEGYCTSCHGAEGQSGNARIPRLDILSADYMRAALEAYRSGARRSGFMQHAAREVPPRALARMAERFATGAAAQGPAPREGEGATLATQGTRDVPACTACHGPGRDPEAQAGPALAGQYAPYIAAQLRLWRAGTRGGGKRAELMRKAAAGLRDADIALLADYFAGLPPAGGPP